MSAGNIDNAPGFRRRLVVYPQADRVTSAVEDDYHCMAVILHHDGARVTAVEAVMDRAPWTTCPGAPAILAATFAGILLAEADQRGDKRINCTHLHDLAVLAAAHAGDSAPTRYDIEVSDPVAGLVAGEIRLNGTAVLRLEHRDDIVTAPSDIAGTSVFKLRGWIETLDSAAREAARLLQWGVILAHGRTIPMDRQSDASRMPPNCYTFQPGMKENASRVGVVMDFSQGSHEPLDHFDGMPGDDHGPGAAGLARNFGRAGC